MKIAYITYYWPPAGGPGVQRAVKFAKFLPEFDIVPYIITVDETKGSYPLKDETLVKDVLSTAKVIRTDTFEPLTLYSRLLKKEIPYSGFANESNPSLIQKLSRFIRGNLFIPDARRGWNRYALKAAVKLIKEENIEAIITSSPPHSTQLIGLKLKKIFNIPWIADLRDPWTDIYYYDLMMHTPMAKKLDKRYEREVLEKADAVLVTNRDTRDLFASKSPIVNKNKIHVIYNGFDEDDFDYSLAKETPYFTITYTGTIASNYYIDSFIEAVHRLVEKEKEDTIKLRFVGKVAEGIRQKLNVLGKAVEYISYVPHQESIKYLLSSSALLLMIPNVKKSEAILPGKLFEYLAARKPIICLGTENGDVSKILSDCQAGKSFNGNQKEVIVQYLSQLYRDWKVSNKTAVSGDKYLQYSRRAQSEQLSKIINILT